MKINLEKAFLFVFIISLVVGAIYFVSPEPDIYVHYVTAREILKDPSIVWRTNLTGWQSFVAIQSSALTAYPPLLYIIFALLMAVYLPPFLITIISIVIIGYFLYKLDGKAIPFMFLSFLLIKDIVFNNYDIFQIALTLTSFYFLIKKNYITSGILVGITPLLKSTGFFAVLAWLTTIVIAEKKNIFKKRIVIAILLAIFISFPWYFRNYLIFGNIYLAIVGQSSESLAASMKHLSSAFQMSQPERFLWDSTGYYPLPIDLLFYIGLIFFAYNLVKTREIKVYSALIIIMAGVYFALQLSGNPFFVIRHEMIIFPFLALEIARGIPEKYFKYTFIICLVLLVFFLYNIPKYAFNQYLKDLQPACNQLRSEIGNEPVYIDAFHNWFVTYECNLNTTTKDLSKWTADFNSGQLYLTNMTNSTSNSTGV